MKNIAAALILLLGSAKPWAQQNMPPQTARQALMEMFFSKTDGTFVKHLPEATRAALEKSGTLAGLQQYSAMARTMQTQEKNLQTFETGSILLATEDPKTGEKAEVTVENDALQGDQDDIELSFQTYKNSQPVRTPFMPHVTFSMKMEGGTWKLNEISLTMHLPLADPDLLKAFTERMKPQPQTLSNMHSQITVNGQPALRAQSSANDAQVLDAIRTILTAEIVYASTYHNVGYTCTLSNLDGFGGGEPNERQAMLINSGLASGHKYGYVISLSDCSGSPAKNFHLTATPNANMYGHRAYCTDQSAVVKYSEDGNAATCLNSGTPVH